MKLLLVAIITAMYITIVIVPNEDVDDTPVSETVSSARFPHSLSFHAFAPQPVASNCITVPIRLAPGESTPS